jgi:hypothetical protein
MTTSAGPATRFELADDFVTVNEYFHDQGWSDGLPVMPPTEDAVAAMVAAGPLAASDVLGIMSPIEGTVTVEKVAANAVMAGCKPAYFPVVIAGVKALLQPKYNVGSVSTTTGGAAPCFIVSGSIADALEINGGTACMGSGFRANATIGRALRLVIRNIGGAIPGEMDKGTLAFPGRYSLLFAENEARNPWEPLRVNRGYAIEDSTISVMGIRGIHYINEGAQETGLGNLETIAGSMRRMGLVNYLHQLHRTAIGLVLGPEHAHEIAEDGFSRQDVQQYLFEHARMPVRDLDSRSYWNFRQWPEEYEADNPDFMVPIVYAPEDFVIVVAGGDGRHSAWLSSWYMTQCVTERIEIEGSMQPIEKKTGL